MKDKNPEQAEILFIKNVNIREYDGMQLFTLFMNFWLCRVCPYI